MEFFFGLIIGISLTAGAFYYFVHKKNPKITNAIIETAVSTNGSENATTDLEITTTSDSELAAPTPLSQPSPEDIRSEIEQAKKDSAGFNSLFSTKLQLFHDSVQKANRQVAELNKDSDELGKELNINMAASALIGRAQEWDMDESTIQLINDWKEEQLLRAVAGRDTT